MPPESDDDGIATTPRNTGTSRDTDIDVPDSPESAERDVSDTLPEREGKTSDTLLSVRPSAPGSQETTDPRVDEHDRRLQQLEARVKVLELTRGLGLASERKWLIWVGLLLALALGWQLRSLFK